MALLIHPRKIALARIASCDARQMIRRHGLPVALAGAVVAVIVLVVWFREDAELIQALATGGTLLTAVFASVAALAARNAAQESSQTAERAREALARLNKPTMHAAIHRDSNDPNTAVGSYGPGQRAARDVRITWHLRNGQTVERHAGDMVPEPTGRNPHLPYTMPLGPWHGSEAATATRAVIEYTDEAGLMRWRFTRRFMTAQEWRAVGHEPPTDDGMTYLDSDEPIG